MAIPHRASRRDTIDSLLTFQRCLVGREDIDLPLRLEHLPPALSSIEIAQRCGDARANADAMDLVFNIHLTPGSTRDRAVYVLSSEREGLSKIGLSGDPKRRLLTFNSSSPDRMVMRYLFWPVGCDGLALERAALSSARDLGLLIKGEWVSVAAESAAVLVAQASKDAGLRVADSRTWLLNRLSKLTLEGQVRAGASSVGTFSPAKPRSCLRLRR